jgi:hypothetical protein
MVIILVILGENIGVLRTNTETIRCYCGRFIVRHSLRRLEKSIISVSVVETKFRQMLQGSKSELRCLVWVSSSVSCTSSNLPQGAMLVTCILEVLGSKLGHLS